MGGMFAAFAVQEEVRIDLETVSKEAWPVSQNVERWVKRLGLGDAHVVGVWG